MIKGYRIKTVSRLTGLSEAVLRTWERRYQVVSPRRTAGGYREYAEGDVQRLRLLRALTEGGHPIGEVAQLPTDDLQRLQARVEGAPPAVARPSYSPEASAAVAAMVAAARGLDAGSLAEPLGRALVSAPGAVVCAELLLPVMAALEVAGSGRPRVPDAPAVLAREVVRGYLGALCLGAPPGAPLALVAAGPSSGDEGTALCAALALLALRWRVAYLGTCATLPPLLSLAAATSPRVALLAWSQPPEAGAFLPALDGFKEGLPVGVLPVLYGAALQDFRIAIERRGASWARGEAALAEWVEPAEA